MGRFIEMMSFVIALPILLLGSLLMLMGASLLVIANALAGARID